MIPSIETIVEDLVAGRITKSQAVTWLYAHAEGATQELRDHFAAAVIQGMMANSLKLEASLKFPDWDLTIAAHATESYQVADAMIEARKEGK